MGLFNRDKKDHGTTTAEPTLEVVNDPVNLNDLHAPVEAGISLAKGNVSLSKGDAKVCMQKAAVVTFKCSWPPSKDYDAVAQAMVAENGKPVQVDVAAYGTIGGPGMRMRYDAKDGGWIEHMGDIKTEGGTEIIRAHFSPMILAISFFAYSAKANGAGSFKRYGVSMEMDNGAGTKITITDKDASSSESVYTCVPATVTNTPDGLIVDPTARYSHSGSENRPKLEWKHGKLVVEMDKFFENEHK